MINDNKTKDQLKLEFILTSRMNIHYNDRMEKRSDRILNVTSFLSIIFSSATFLSLMDVIQGQVMDIIATIFIPLSVTILNALVLVAGHRRKFVLYRDLRKDWIAFLTQVEMADFGNLDEIRRLEIEMSKIEIREPSLDKKLLRKSQEYAENAVITKDEIKAA